MKFLTICPLHAQYKNKLYSKCCKQNNLELVAYHEKYFDKLVFIKRLAKEHYWTLQLQWHKQDISKQYGLIINELLGQNKRCSNATIHKLTTMNDEKSQNLK